MIQLITLSHSKKMVLSFMLVRSIGMIPSLALTRPEELKLSFSLAHSRRLIPSLIAVHLEGLLRSHLTGSLGNSGTILFFDSLLSYEIILKVGSHGKSVSITPFGSLFVLALIDYVDSLTVHDTNRIW